jgi:transcriptional regulator with XRE-family HTH domain
MILADKSIDDLAYELDVSRKTIERTMRGERLLKRLEREYLAKALGVPESFLLDGLSAGLTAPGRAALTERLNQVDELIRALEEERSWIKRSLSEDP